MDEDYNEMKMRHEMELYKLEKECGHEEIINDITIDGLWMVTRKICKKCHKVFSIDRGLMI